MFVNLVIITVKPAKIHPLHAHLVLFIPLELLTMPTVLVILVTMIIVQPSVLNVLINVMDVQGLILLNVSLVLYPLKGHFNLINLVLVTQDIMMMV